jgi:hypothetical protein
MTALARQSMSAGGYSVEVRGVFKEIRWEQKTSPNVGRLAMTTG